MNSKRFFISILSLFIVFFLGIIYLIVVTSIKVNLDDPNKILLRDFGYQKINNKGAHIFSYEKNILKKEFDKIDGETIKVIVYRLAGQSYEIYLNDILIGSVASGVNSNIWNSIHSFDVDKKTLKESNALVFKVVGYFEVGLLSIPIILTSKEDGIKIYNWFTFLINLYVVTMGFLLACFFLLIFFSFSKNKFNPQYLFFGLSTLFLAIYILDNLTIYKLNISLITFKKITFSSLYASIGFISLALYYYFKKNILKYFSILTFLSLIPIIFLSLNMAILKTISTFLSLLILINIFIWAYVTGTNLKGSNFSKTFFSISLLSLVIVGMDVFNNFSSKTNEFNLFSLNIYSFVFLFLTLTILVFYEYLNLEEKVIFEKERAKIYYEMATKDQMTDCYNHQFIANYLKDYDKQYSIIMFDIDNFKPINDTYGHLSGDFVIKKVASTIKKKVRKNDIVGRYGGDEFVAVLPSCDGETAFLIANEVLTEVRDIKHDTNGNILNLSLSIGIYSSDKNETSLETLRKSDEALYISKNNGKNQINLYK